MPVKTATTHMKSVTHVYAQSVTNLVAPRREGECSGLLNRSGLISAVDSSCIVGIRVSLPGNALRLADHPLQLLRPGVSAINFRHTAQVAQQAVRRDLTRIRTRCQPL
jgi:hypothetical protein